MNVVGEVPDSQDNEDQYFASSMGDDIYGELFGTGRDQLDVPGTSEIPGSTVHRHQMDTRATSDQQNGSFGADSIMQDVAMNRNAPGNGDTDMNDGTATMDDVTQGEIRGDQYNTEQPTETANSNTEEPFSDSLDDIVLDIVYTYKRLWPLDRDVFLAPHELPHSRPGETRVPPCTVRYRLPIGVNTNNDIVVAKVRDLLIREIKRENRGKPSGICANAVQITFPKQLEKRDDRFYTVDVTANSPAHFRMIRAIKFTVNRQVLDILDTG
jgi:hypothetical protein